MRGPGRSSGQRSGLYSRSKFSNWTPFNPFWSEAETALKLKRPEETFEAPERKISLPIYSMELHPQFLRPCSASEVSEVLRSVPSEFLVGLEGVYLLGGSKKQISARRLRLYGSYSPGHIYLYAYPCCMMERQLRRAPKPSVQRKYERAGGRGDRNRRSLVSAFHQGQPALVLPLRCSSPRTGPPY